MSKREATTLLTCCFLIAFPSRGHAEPPLAAAEDGPCSLAQATPVNVAVVDEDFELLLDDGRRVAIAGLEFPLPGSGAGKSRERASRRLSDWLVGEQVFLGALAPAPDRWGRTPAQAIAAADGAPDAPLVSVGAAMLAEGLARFRPDPLATPCASVYLKAESVARDGHLGVWATDPVLEIPADPGAPAPVLTGRKGMTVVSGVVRSIGETRGAIYLNFGRSRDFAVVISKRNAAIFAQNGIIPQTLTGRRIRVRGLIETNYGPRMEIAAPSELELLDPAPER